MTEQNQTHDIADDEDTEGHARRGTDDHTKDDDDVEGHARRGTDDHTKDDDTEGRRPR